MTDFDFYDTETAQRFYDEEQRIMHTNEPLIGRIEKESWKTGATTWVSHSKKPLRLDAGETIGLIGISRDVTEEHISKQQLKEQNETMRADIASAEKVKHIMTPGRLPSSKGIKLAYVWKPMTSVGGDIISFPRNPDDTLIFFMADVCGHGVQAAFYTVLLKYMTAHAAEEHKGSPERFLNRVNDQVIDRIDNGFVTAVARHFGLPEADGSRSLYLSNAGHPDLLILRSQSNSVERVKLPSALVMGLPTGQSSPTIQYRVEPGDRVYFFTDGIVETSTPSGEEFGLDRLQECIEANSNRHLQEGLDDIFKRAQQHTGNSAQQDDISLLAFEIQQQSMND